MSNHNPPQTDLAELLADPNLLASEREAIHRLLATSCAPEPAASPEPKQCAEQANGVSGPGEGPEKKLGSLLQRSTVQGPGGADQRV